MEKVLMDDSAPVSPSGRELNIGPGVQRIASPQPAVMTGRESRLDLPAGLERRQTMVRSVLDYTVPIVEEQPALPKTIAQRMEATIKNAESEEAKYTRKGM